MAESVTDLLKLAESGAQLGTQQRRRVIASLDAGDKYHTAEELGVMLHVDDRTIRSDRYKIGHSYAQNMDPQHAMRFVVDFVQDHDRMIRKARRALDNAVEGTLAHQNYLKLLSDLSKRKIETLQSIGAIPKELGRLNVSEEHWVATTEGDVTTVSPAPARAEAVKMLEAGEEIQDAETLEDETPLV
jgi:hypothetical protein